MVDNLMDLTHLGYVHRRTIGGNPSQHVDAKMETVPTQNGLRFTRWMLASPPPPTYVRAYGFKGKVDRWQVFEWVAPSNILQWTGAKDAGTGAYEGNRDGGFQFKVFHGLTPETATSCHYYFATANYWTRPTTPRRTSFSAKAARPSSRTRTWSSSSRRGSPSSARIGWSISSPTRRASACAGS